MAEFRDLFNQVLPDLPQVPEPLVTRAIRNAVIQLCERTRVLRETLPAIDVEADQAEYSIAPSQSHHALVHARNVLFDEKPVERKTQDQLDLEWSEAQDRFSYLFYHRHAYTGYDADDWTQASSAQPRYYFEKRPAKIRLVATPSTAITGGLVVTIAVKPQRDATTVEDWLLEDYFREIARGALAELFAIPKKDWTEPQLAEHYRQLFEQDLGRIHGDSLRDWARDDRPVGRVQSYA